MSSITVRNIDAELKQRLKEQAARHGVSMEEEVRRILREAVPKFVETGTYRSGKELYEEIRGIVEPLGGIELELPPRHTGCPNPCCKEAEGRGLE